MLTMRFVLLVLVVFLVGTTSATSQPSSNDKGIANKDQESEQKKDARTIDISSLEKAIRESIKEASEKPDTHAEEKLKIDQQIVEFTRQLADYTNKLSVYTLWLVIVTGFLVYVGVRQELHSRDTARKELRAYVALNDIFFLGYEIPISDQKLIHYSDHLKIKIQNYGQTPSFDTSISCSSSIQKPATFNAGGPGVGKQMLHPGMSYSIEITESSSPKSSQQGWVWGHLIYRDIYKRWWRTNFFYAHHSQSKFTPETEHNNEQGPYKTEADALRAV